MSNSTYYDLLAKNLPERWSTQTWQKKRFAKTVRRILRDAAKDPEADYREEIERDGHLHLHFVPDAFTVDQENKMGQRADGLTRGELVESSARGLRVRLRGGERRDAGHLPSAKETREHFERLRRGGVFVPIQFNGPNHPVKLASGLLCSGKIFNAVGEQIEVRL